MGAQSMRSPASAEVCLALNHAQLLAKGCF